MRTLRSFSDFFLYSNIFISLCAAAASYQTLLVAGKTDLSYLVFVFCSTFVFYNGQRIFLSKNYNKEISSERHRWIAAHLKILAVLCIVAFVAAIPVVLRWEWNMVFVFALFCLLASLYFIPQVNFRAIPGLKAAYISLIWVFSTVVFPLMLAGNSDIISVLRSFHLFTVCQRFLFILPLCIVFNIRDMEYDKSTGVKTLPLILGINATKIICLVLLFLFCGFVPYPDSSNGIALIASAIITAVLILFASQKRNEYYYVFVIDGMILLQAGMVWLGSVK